MSTKKYGALSFARQPESELIYRPEGLIEGQIVYEFDWNSSRTAVRRLLNTKHPDDPNVILYAMREQKLRLGKGRAVFDCIGLTKSPTDRISQLVPSVRTESIQTHPAFNVLAGTPDAPQNGAKFDAETGEFLGWFGGGSVGTGLRGVESYYTGTSIVRAVFYTNTPMTLPRAFSIVTAIPNVQFSTGTPNFLYMPPTLDPVGTSGICRISEEFMGSGPGGWNSNIYA